MWERALVFGKEICYRETHTHTHTHTHRLNVLSPAPPVTPACSETRKAASPGRYALEHVSVRPVCVSARVRVLRVRAYVS